MPPKKQMCFNSRSDALQYYALEVLAYILECYNLPPSLPPFLSLSFFPSFGDAQKQAAQG